MPRKTQQGAVLLMIEGQASMRPRPDAAENTLAGATMAPGAHASMRPRPDAAENFRGAAGEALHRAVASMRPRPDAAENWMKTH